MLGEGAEDREFIDRHTLGYRLSNLRGRETHLLGWLGGAAQGEAALI